MFPYPTLACFWIHRFAPAADSLRETMNIKGKSPYCSGLATVLGRRHLPRAQGALGADGLYDQIGAQLLAEQAGIEQ